MSKSGKSFHKSLTPIVVAAFLFISGLIGVFFALNYAGLEYGIRLVFHDPGKFLFHLILLPLSVWVFLSEFPLKLITQAKKIQKGFIVFFVFLGIFLTAVGTVNDHYDGICERFSSPIDFSSEEVRRKLLDIQMKGHEKMRDQSSSEEFKQASQEAYNRYKIVLDDVRSGNCEYLSLSGPAQFWSLILSFLGTLFAVSVFWLLLVHLIVRKKPSPELLSAYLVIYSLTIPWLLLRAYSEWYINFGIGFLENYRTMTIAVFLAVIMGFILFALSIKRGTRLIVISALTGIPTILSVVGALNHEWFSYAAQIWHSLDISEIVIMYGIFIPAAGCLVYYIYGPEEYSDSSLHEEQ